MMRKSIVCLFCVIAAGVQLRATQDFERSYAVSPGAFLSINNKMGDIKVTVYEGKEIKVFAHTEGPDRNAVEIIENSFGKMIELRPISKKFKSNKTRVDFEVKVPESGRTVTIRLTSRSGKIEVSDFGGSLWARSTRGDVKVVNVQGNVFATSDSGNMDAEIMKGQPGPRQIMLNSSSGNINVKVPSDFDAWVWMSTSGLLKTDLPISHSQGRYGIHTAHGKIGSGKQAIRIQSALGSVSLMKE